MKKEEISITTKKGPFGRKPVDFEDLGKTGAFLDKESGEMVYNICNLCHKILRAGEKEEKGFYWCKNCGKPYSL